MSLARFTARSYRSHAQRFVGHPSACRTAHRPDVYANPRKRRRRLRRRAIQRGHANQEKWRYAK